MSQQRPSGPDWQRYKKSELRHWKKHGRGSGRYHTQHGQRWRLDRKAEAGKPVRFSAKSVDVKNQESRDHFSKREQKIKAQTSKYADKTKANAKRAKINGQGKQSHHIAGVDRVDNGLVKKYKGKIPDKVRKQFAKVGVHFGDDHRNLQAVDSETHKRIHREEKRVDASLQELERSQKFKGGLNAMRGFPGQSLAPTSGSQIVDRANGNMQLNGNAATLGVPLDLF